MPHFVNVNVEKDQIYIRPKCQECYYVPDTSIAIDSKPQGGSIRGLVGHHTVTGERGENRDEF